MNELYVIINWVREEGRVISLTRSAISAGVGLLQLRFDDNTNDRTKCKLAGIARDLTRHTPTRLIINNRPDIARIVDADGVHLGQDDITIEDARRVVGLDRIIGSSTHSLREARDARDRGADYISVGPVWNTPTKPEYPAAGLELIRQVAGEIEIPVFAIGGINLDNIEEVVRAGVRRIAVVRAFGEADDPREAALRLKEKINDAIRACLQK